MRLRNKRTGEIIETCKIIQNAFGEIIMLTLSEDERYPYEYYSLAELNADWEDYKPKEPLIKDEKIRKAVRAWAEADDLDNFRVQNQHFNDCKIIGYTAGINKASFIGFQTTIARADSKKLYTIPELCGEDDK